MPPAKKRARTYDPVRTRAAVLGQYGAVRDAVRGLSQEQLAGDTRRAGWSVRELVVHIGMAVTALQRAIAHPEPAKADAVLLDWPFATAANSAAIDAFT